MNETNPGELCILIADAVKKYGISWNFLQIFYRNQISGVQIFTTTHNTDLMSNDLLRPDS